MSTLNHFGHNEVNCKLSDPHSPPPPPQDVFMYFRLVDRLLSVLFSSDLGFLIFLVEKFFFESDHSYF